MKGFGVVPVKNEGGYWLEDYPNITSFLNGDDVPAEYLRSELIFYLKAREAQRNRPNWWGKLWTKF